MDAAPVPEGAVVAGLEIASWADLPRLLEKRPDLIVEHPLVYERPALQVGFQASYELDEKGRIVMRSLEALP